MKKNKNTEEEILDAAFFVSELDNMINFALKNHDINFLKHINKKIFNHECNSVIPIEIFVKLYKENGILNHFVSIGEEKFIKELLECQYFDFSEEELLFAINISLMNETVTFNSILNHLFIKRK